MFNRKLVVAVVFGAIALTASAEPRYSVAAQLDRFFPKGLNNAGQVSGDMALGGWSHAFLWSPSGLVDLGTLGGQVSSAAGLNDLGHVVGTSEVPNGPPHMFVYANGRMQDIGNFGSDLVEARDINNAGQIVGLYRRTWPEYRAFSYANGSMMDLGDLGADPAYAADINNQGDITGGAGLANAGQQARVHAYLYRDGTMRDLGGFGAPGAGSSFASAINEEGDVVGTALGGSGEERAFLWRDNVMYNLGTLGGASSAAADINEAGQVVGASDGTAFLFEAGAMANLNELVTPIPGWHLTNAVAINDRGQILAYGCQADATCSTFLLQALPVPEPGMAGMLTAGLAILAWKRRRKRAYSSW